MGMHVYSFIIQCPSPYVGDGVLCALDSDNDGYPNVATLPSCDIDNNDTFCKLVHNNFMTSCTPKYVPYTP